MLSQFYYRKLPHFQPDESSFFVTFRLAGSIPMDVLYRLQENHQLLEKGILAQKDLTDRERSELLYAEQKRLFGETDTFLDNNPNGPYWLQEQAVAEMVAPEMLRHDGKWYTLWAYCIMSNHVHVVLTLHKKAPFLTKIMQIKVTVAKKQTEFWGCRASFGNGRVITIWFARMESSVGLYVTLFLIRLKRGW